MPGDAIVVPENFERTTWVKDLKDWTRSSTSSGSVPRLSKFCQD